MRLHCLLMYKKNYMEFLTYAEIWTPIIFKLRLSYYCNANNSSVEMSEKSWNQIEEYVWKWYPILIGAASFEDEKKKPFIT